jgi:hypothetical protein
MQVKIDLIVPCETIEEMLYVQYRLDEPAKLTNMEYDEMGDLCAFTFAVDEEDSTKVSRDWSDDSFAEGLISEAI